MSNSWEDDVLENTIAHSSNGHKGFNKDEPRRKPENFLGVITEGSLAKGLQARIRTRLPLETIQTGQFVTIQAEGVRFFGLLTDVTLHTTSPSILLDPPSPDDETPSLVREVLKDVYTYGEAHLQPSLALPNGENQPKPIRSVPSHFTPVYIAEAMDFENVFGLEDIGQGGTSFAIGQPLDMENEVCLNLEKFVERSNGIFGKSGTGKSVLTKLILAGLIKSGVCSNLVFDMHNEYGEGKQGEGGYKIRGLKSLFNSKVMVYAVRQTRPGENRREARREIHADGDLVIGMNQIEVEDITLLREVLELNATAAESAYIFQDDIGSNWISKLLKMEGEELKEFCERKGANVNSVSALRRKLLALQRLPFVEENSSFGMVDEIMLALEKGKHVVVEFGNCDDLLSYMLVANIITRRIYNKYKDKVNRSQSEADRPNRIMITIEEAHRFLTSEVANQTIFGKIAREMRKYNVTLLVVDQRPSSIDNEVLSQIGTRIVALINDERDIEAVFTGISGSSGLKTVLASLDSRQQALVLGHAVPMPVVIRTRPFDQNFYKFIQAGGTFDQNPTVSDREPFEDWERQHHEQQLEKDEADLFG